MGQAGKGKKAVSLTKKKDGANTARKTIYREAEDFNSMLARMEEDQNRRGYTPKKQKTMSNKMKSVMNKLMGKDMPKKKRKKTAPCPILGAVLKFHNDDDTDDDKDDGKDDNMGAAAAALVAA